MIFKVTADKVAYVEASTLSNAVAKVKKNAVATPTHEHTVEMITGIKIPVEVDTEEDINQITYNDGTKSLIKAENLEKTMGFIMNNPDVIKVEKLDHKAVLLK